MQKWEQRIQISWQQERNRAVLGEERKEKLMVKVFYVGDRADRHFAR